MNAQPMKARRKAYGMTLVEVSVSLAVITLVILTTVSVMHSTANFMKFELVVSDQQSEARDALDAMMEEMRKMSGSVKDFDSTSGVNTNTVTGANVVDSVTFTAPYYDAVTKAVNMGSVATAITYRWSLNPNETPGNAQDDDGNGLSDNDDGRLERYEGTDLNTLTVVCDNVPRSSFLVVKNGRELHIRIGRKNNTPLVTEDGTRIETVVTHNRYCLRNF